MIPLVNPRRRGRLQAVPAVESGANETVNIMDGRRTSVLKPLVVAVAAGWLALSLVGCASAPADEGPEEVVGQPPQPDSEDYEPAPPPSHPGEHGKLGGDTTAQQDQHTGSEPGVVTQQQLDRLQSLGPSVVMEHVVTEPVRDDGQFVGFEIVEVSDTARRHIEPDLQTGDVITHVNQVRLEMPDDYMEAWKTLEEADEIRVDLVRDGDEQEVILDVQ